MTGPRGHRPARQFTRRHLLQGVALGGVAAFLAACRSAVPVASGPAATSARGTPVTSPGAASTAPGASSDAVVGGTFDFANWGSYIDLTPDAGPDGIEGTDDDGFVLPSPTLDTFSDATGIAVNYAEAIRTNEDFLASDLQGPLSQGKPTAWDLIVLTDYMAARLIRMGWVETIDTTGMTNFPANLGPIYLGRTFDPGARMTAPWQSGMTGLGYDSGAAGTLDSLDSLWSTKHAGKIGFVQDMRDAVGLSAIRLGIDPAAIDDAGFERALGEIQVPIDRNSARFVSSDSYTDELQSGKLVVSMAYSNDILRLRDEMDAARFTVPREGGMLWTDNLMIPKGAPNKAQAEQFIDFYYDPGIAAQVADFVEFVCPVTGANEAMTAINSSNADNPLIFPPADVVARLRVFKGLDEATEQRYQAAWQKVAGT